MIGRREQAAGDAQPDSAGLGQFVKLKPTPKLKRTIRNILESLERADQFLTEHPLMPVNAQVTALATQLKAVIVTMVDHRTGQDLGIGKALGGTARKTQTASELRTQMSAVSKIAKELDPTQFPGVREALFMPRYSYQKLQSRADAFLTTIAPIKSAFVDRGLPEDFDEQLQKALDAFVLAALRQSSGRAQRVQGTAGLEISGRAGRKIVRAIDSILFAIYRNQPHLYAAWKSASRVEQTNVATPVAPASAQASEPATAETSSTDRDGLATTKQPRTSCIYGSVEASSGPASAMRPDINTFTSS